MEGPLFMVGDTRAHLHPAGNDRGERERQVTWTVGMREGGWPGPQHVSAGRQKPVQHRREEDDGGDWAMGGEGSSFSGEV